MGGAGGGGAHEQTGLIYWYCKCNITVEIVHVNSTLRRLVFPREN